MSGTDPVAEAGEAGLCAVHVVHLSEIAADRTLLSPEELQRADRFVVAGPADQFVRSRVLLRTVLGDLLGRPPLDVELEFGAHGRPGLRTEEGIDFNLSHSGPWAALGVSDQGPIGVDIEVCDERRSLQRLARRFFSRSEADWFEALAPERRRTAFYRLWTLKEAYLKALGTGLTFSSRRFSFRIEAGLAPRLVHTEWPGESALDWRFDELAVPPPGEAAGSGPAARLAVCRPASDARRVAFLWRRPSGGRSER